jgi:TRAP transporter TAXI family solute receptor
VHIQVGVPVEYPASTVKDVFEMARTKPITIGTTPPGGSDEWVMRKVFEFYKTTYNDVRSKGGKVILVSYSDLTTQYRDRNMDVFFANLAVPGAAIQEASLGRKMRILPMDDDLIKFMEGHGLSRGVIPKGSYKDVVNNDADIPTIAMANTIVANAKVPADVVHDFTKVLVGNVDSVRKVHPAFKDFDPKDAPKLGSLPLHPGAERAYREAGLLK